MSMKGARIQTQLYPDFTAEIDAIDQAGISDALINRIIDKHSPNALCSALLLDRYSALLTGVPIFGREARFSGVPEQDAINHRINNDFFGEIVDFKTGYFAGNPISYSYSDGREALDFAGQAQREAASKALTDFVARSNMFDLDMECTKLASICGYCGRLLYIDDQGEARAMAVPPHEVAILSRSRDLTWPTYALRYYVLCDIYDNPTIKAEFYDAHDVYYAQGQPGALRIERSEPHLFDLCPLQGIPNNREMLGDAEKVLALIDAYDRALSDASNELDSFANAYMVFENIDLDDEQVRRLQKSGAFSYYTNSQTGGRVYFLTKDINDAFIEHHLDRLEENIYRFSKTPNLSDEAFGTSSGVALKFKLTGLEAKCGMFEAKHISASNYMFRLLAGVWAKQGIRMDPLLCVTSYKRNFPLDVLSEAQAAQALIAAGFPKRAAYESALSFVDDVEYIMQQIEAEKGDIIPLDSPDEDGM